MTWSDDGRQWFVDERPWLDEFRWTEALERAAHLAFDQRNRPAGMIGSVCTRCYDTGFLMSFDADWYGFVVYCPDCRPIAYRRQVTTSWLTWSETRARAEEPAWAKTA